MEDWWQTLRPAVKLRLIHIHWLMRQGKVAQARAEMFQLWDIVLRAYYAGKLRGGMSMATQNAVLQFGQLLYCLVGLDGSGLTLGDPLGTGNVTQVVFPSPDPQFVRHGSGNAGVKVYGNTLTQPATITVSTITPPEGQFAGPLNTTLDQYGPFFEFHVVPEQTFSQPVLVEECLTAPVGDLPTTVLLAHNVGTGIEILPRDEDHLLDCTGSTAAAPSAGRLFASGDLGGALRRLGEQAISVFTPENLYAPGTGVSGKPKNFSPFGGVDTRVLLPWESGGYRYLVGGADHDGGFEAAGFNDAAWAVGRGGFSDHVAPAVPYCPIDATAHTAWNSVPFPTDLLLRHSFTLPAGWSTDLRVSVAIDNDIEVFVDGHAVTGEGFVTHQGCATRDSFIFTVPAAVLSTSTTTHVIAVRARDRGTAAFVDIQLTTVTP